MFCCSWKKIPHYMLWIPNFLEGNNLLKRLNHLVPPLYLNFKTLRVPNPMSLSKFQCILYDSTLLFSVFKNFLKLKRSCVISSRHRGWGGGGEVEGGVEPTLQYKTAHLVAASLYFNFKDWRSPNCIPLVLFQCILHDLFVLLSVL